MKNKRTIKATEQKIWNNDSLEIERVLWYDGEAHVSIKYIKGVNLK